MKKQIITVLVLGAIAVMPFSAAVSAAESAQWRKYTTRAKQRAAEEAAAKEEKDKEAALARQKQKKSFPTSLCGNAIRAAAKRHEKRLREKA